MRALVLSQALTALGEHEQAKRALTSRLHWRCRAVPCAVRLQPSNMWITVQDRAVFWYETAFELQAQRRTALLM